MGVGDRSKFHLHLPHLNLHCYHHHHHYHHKGVPKGCIVVMVGREAEEPLQRCVIPVLYLNDPLFMDLLSKAEKEYGFHHEGPIVIPCHVDEFKTVQGKIDGKHHHKSLHRRPEDHHHHHFLCFKP